MPISAPVQGPPSTGVSHRLSKGGQDGVQGDVQVQDVRGGRGILDKLKEGPEE